MLYLNYKISTEFLIVKVAFDMFYLLVAGTYV